MRLGGARGVATALDKTMKTISGIWNSLEIEKRTVKRKSKCTGRWKSRSRSNSGTCKISQHDDPYSRNINEHSIPFLPSDILQKKLTRNQRSPDSRLHTTLKCPFETVISTSFRQI